MEPEGDTHYYHYTLQRTSDYHSFNELLFFGSKSYKSILSKNILLGVCRGLTCTTVYYITEEQRKKRTEYSDILWLSSHGAHIAGKPSPAKMYQVASINHLTPNDHFSGRTAPLNFRCCIFLFIQQIYVLNILNMLHTLCFSFFKMQFIS